MDDTRQLLVSACASLARLQLRLLNLAGSPRRSRGGRLSEAKWTLADLQPGSSWFGMLNGGTPVEIALRDVAAVSAHLLSMLDGDGPIDGRLACLFLQHVAGLQQWSQPVLRLAQRLGVTLAASPADERDLIGIVGRSLPGRQRQMYL